jgi:hypothetical protein
MSVFLVAIWVIGIAGAIYQIIKIYNNNKRTKNMKTELFFYPECLTPKEVKSQQFKLGSKFRGKSKKQLAKYYKRRSVVAGVILDNKLRMAKAECSFKDVFVKKVGRDKAKGRALAEHNVHPSQKVIDITDYAKFSDVVNLFVTEAKKL